VTLSSRSLACFVLGMFLIALASLAATAAVLDAGPKTPAFAPDEILVKFKPGLTDAGMKALLGAQGATITREVQQLGVKVLKVPSGRVMDMVKAFQGSGQVDFAEPNYLANAILTPNDPSFSSQWGMTKILAPGAWDNTLGLNTVKIAILDTGIDNNHEDLAAKIVATNNFTSSTTSDDLYGHGTHVAGIAAAISNNAKGVAGVGFNCALMSGKVLKDDGYGTYDWIASGLCWAADSGAKVINMSLGGGGASTTLENAVNYAWGKGSVVVAAAGNSNTTAASYPAYYTNCIAVGATDNADNRASFSNYGSWVDVAAPGVGIYSTLPNHSNSIGALNYGSLNGTSMACPHVAGLAALVFASRPGATNASVRARIEQTCDPLSGGWVAKGRVNAYRAVTRTQYGVAQYSNGQQVNFATPFATIPVVITADQSASTAASSITTTGFKINLTTHAGGAASTWVQWIAFNPSAAAEVIGGVITANSGTHVTFATPLSSTPVIVTNAFKDGKALISGAIDNAANGFGVSIVNDQGASVSGATLLWMAVVPKPANGFKGEVKVLSNSANVSFSPAFAAGPAYVLSSPPDVIAGAVSNRNDGFTLSLIKHDGTASDGRWVQWIGYAGP